MSELTPPAIIESGKKKLNGILRQAGGGHQKKKDVQIQTLGVQITTQKLGIQLRQRQHPKHNSKLNEEVVVDFSTIYSQIVKGDVLRAINKRM